VAVGAHTDPEVLALAPVEEVVAALLAGRAQFDTSYHSSPAAPSSSSAIR
jgi:hypothetical protein